MTLQCNSNNVLLFHATVEQLMDTIYCNQIFTRKKISNTGPIGRELSGQLGTERKVKIYLYDNLTQLAQTSTRDNSLLPVTKTVAIKSITLSIGKIFTPMYDCV